jgi:hypothetical protein
MRGTPYTHGAERESSHHTIRPLPVRRNLMMSTSLLIRAERIPQHRPPARPPARPHMNMHINMHMHADTLCGAGPM